MKYSYYVRITIYLTFIFANTKKSEAQSRSQIPRKINAATLNQKAVGLQLKANGKRYYISSELCPGGVFLTRPVNENCLCYNGIFQIVRECCHPSHTRIHSDNLEWRMDFKCGSSPEVGNSTEHHPIRAILPLTKAHNRFGSVIVTRSLVANNTAKWRKFDTEDIIIGNNARVDMNGKMQFEIVHIKPLGREIKITFGKFSEMTACYTGWMTEEGHQNLRVKVLVPGETPSCCFNITRFNSPGEITANCSKGTITTEIIDVQSADVDIGQCEQQIPEEAPHTINKRNPSYSVESQNIDQILEQDIGLNENGADIIGDRGPILIRRNAKVNSTSTTTAKPSASPKPTNGTKGNNTSSTTPSPSGNGNGTSTGATDITPEGIIIPRRKGISILHPIEQAEGINEFIAILRNDLNVEIREPQTPRFQLLKATFDVFLAVVPNQVVPKMMIKTAFDVFYFLYEELDPVVYNQPELFNKTMHYLHKCLKHEKPLNFSTTGCPQQIDELIIDENIKSKLDDYYKDQPELMDEVLKALKHVQIRKDRRFIPESHDIYVEINWKVIDFVHSLCFDYFSKEFNSHTYYEQEMEELLKQSVVQQRWVDTPRKDLRYVSGIFPVSDLKLSMKQLDKVSAIGHYLSRYNGSYWLERPRGAFGLQFSYDKVPVLYSNGRPGANSEARLIFAKNLLDDAQAEAKNEQKNALFTSRSDNAGSSAERSLTYPFQYPNNIPPGEMIWDGLAICLHAHYSNSPGYFVNSDLWGLNPPLLELGHLYP